MPTTDSRRDPLSERAARLHTAAERQIGELIDALSTTDQATLAHPCPGREKLGDGTIAAIAAHTAQNYQRIGIFLAPTERVPTRQSPQRNAEDRVRGLPRGLRHKPPENTDHVPGDRHGDGHNPDRATAPEIIQGLRTARDRLAVITRLTDEQLDAVPPKESFRLCDGKRTLEQVLAGLLKHQAHQVQAVKAALSRARSNP
jgi:hypothetical protein